MKTTRSRLHLPFVLSAALLALLSGSAASYGQLLGNDFLTGQIYDINTATGAATNGRGSGAPSLTGIAFQPSSGNLFGLTTFGGTPANSLVRINPTTGVSTLVGATGLSVIAEGDLAFNPLTGNLYGIQNFSRGINLFQINVTTGLATTIGSLGDDGDFSTLAFNSAGVLFTVDTTNNRLDTVNLLTGALLTSTALNINPGTVAGLAFDPTTGVAYFADGGTGGTGQLYTLNTATGAATVVGALGENNIAGLAFRPAAAVASVPDTGSALLLLGLGAGGLFAAHRRARLTA